MKTTSPTQQPPRTVSLCADGGCCPDATFSPIDGTVTLSEFGHAVVLTKASAKKLLQELKRRGYDK